MTTITGIGSQTTSATGLPAASASSAGSAASTAYVNPVNSSSQSGLSSTVVKLSLDSSIVANLNGSTSTTPLYNAVGLLNSITQAGKSSSTESTTTTPATTSAAQAAQDQSVLNTIDSGSGSTASTASTSGIYNASGALQSATTSTDLNTNWANILAATPQAAATLTADTANQAILATL